MPTGEARQVCIGGTGKQPSGTVSLLVATTTISIHPTQRLLMQVPASRGQLLRAVREVWGNTTYEDQFRLAVFSACLNHGLARVIFCRALKQLFC